MDTGLGGSALSLEAWITFNREMWGVEPLLLELRRDHCQLPCLRAALYLNKRGQIILPPRNPYLAMTYAATPAQRPAHRAHQWLAVSEMLAKKMAERGLALSDLCLPPEVEDVRPWQWIGYRAAVRYTFLLDFSSDPGKNSQAIQEQDGNEAWTGCACERTEETSEVANGIQEIAGTMGKHAPAISRRELDMALRIVGPEHYRLYVCHTPEGALASTLIVLHQAGCRAIALFFGTRTKYLDMGLARLLLLRVLNDLWSSGATGFDFGGAFPSSIARSKEPLDGRLAPYYDLEEYNAFRLAQWFGGAFGLRRESNFQKADSDGGSWDG